MRIGEQKQSEKNEIGIKAGVICQIRRSRYEVRGSRYEVRGSRYEVQDDTRYEMRGSRYEVRITN